MIKKIKILLQKKYTLRVIDNQIKTFLDKQFTVNSGKLRKNKKHIIASHILDIFIM